MDAIRNQVEFYFSDSNFRKDAFLKAASEADPEHFVPIATLLTFNKLKALTTDVQEVSEALLKSDSVEVSVDGLKLRRKTTLPENDTSNERTIYVKGYPTDDASITSESVAEQFSAHGKVLMVRLRREKNSKDFKGSVFIEFETEASAVAAIAASNVNGEVKATYKGVPFLCVMAFNDWYKAKQNKWENRKNKTEDQSSNKRKRDDKEVTYTSGLIFHVTGLPTDANTLNLKGFFKTIAEVKFVEYTLGETSAHVRAADADAAATLKAAFDKGDMTYVVEKSEDGPAASSSQLTATLLAGEEELAYWTKIDSSAKSAHKGGRGGGRGGRGGGRGGRGGGRGGGFKKRRN